MNAKELRDKTPDQLREDLANLKKESFNLRFQQATGSMENTARMRAVKRDVARVKTVLNDCLLYTSPSPRDQRGSRMPSSA